MKKLKLSQVFGVTFLLVSLIAVLGITNNPLSNLAIQSYAKYSANALINQRERAALKGRGPQCKGAGCLGAEILANRDNSANKTGVAKQIVDTYDAAANGDTKALDYLKTNSGDLYNKAQQTIAKKAQDQQAQQTAQIQQQCETEKKQTGAGFICTDPAGLNEYLLNQKLTAQQLAARINYNTSGTYTDTQVSSYLSLLQEYQQWGVISQDQYNAIADRAKQIKDQKAAVVHQQSFNQGLQTAISTHPDAAQALLRYKQYGGNITLTSTELNAITNFCADAGGNFSDCGNVTQFAKNYLGLNPVIATNPQTGAQVVIPPPNLTGQLNVNDIPAIAATIPDNFKKTTPGVNNYAVCKGDDDCNSSLTGIYNSFSIIPGFQQYVTAYNPANRKQWWEVNGYSSLEDCQTRAFVRARGLCGENIVTNEQIAGATKFGTNLAAAGELVGTIGGGIIVGGGAIAEGFAVGETIKTVGTIVLENSMAIQAQQASGNAVSSCITNSKSAECKKGTEEAGLAWANVLSMGVLGNLAKGQSLTATLARGANLLVTGANVAQIAPGAYQSCVTQGVGSFGCLVGGGMTILIGGAGTLQTVDLIKNISFKSVNVLADAAKSAAKVDSVVGSTETAAREAAAVDSGASAVKTLASADDAIADVKNAAVKIVNPAEARIATPDEFQKITDLESGLEAPKSPVDILMPETAAADAEQLASLKAKINTGAAPISAGETTITLSDGTKLTEAEFIARTEAQTAAAELENALVGTPQKLAADQSALSLPKAASDVKTAFADSQSLGTSVAEAPSVAEALAKAPEVKAPTVPEQAPKIPSANLTTEARVAELKQTGGLDKIAPNTTFETTINDTVTIKSSQISGINAELPSETGGEGFSVDQIRQLIREGKWDPNAPQFKNAPITGYELPDGSIFIQTGRHRAEAYILEGITDIPNVRIYKPMPSALVVENFGKALEVRPGKPVDFYGTESYSVGGSGQGNQIVLTQDAANAREFELIITKDGEVTLNVGKGNPIKVNGELYSADDAVSVTSGDIISVGGTDYVYSGRFNELPQLKPSVKTTQFTVDTSVAVALSDTKQVAIPKAPGTKISVTEFESGTTPATFRNPDDAAGLIVGKTPRGKLAMQNTSGSLYYFDEPKGIWVKANTVELTNGLKITYGDKLFSSVAADKLAAEELTIFADAQGNFYTFHPGETGLLLTQISGTPSATVLSQTEALAIMRKVSGGTLPAGEEAQVALLIENGFPPNQISFESIFDLGQLNRLPSDLADRFVQNPALEVFKDFQKNQFLYNPTTGEVIAAQAAGPSIAKLSNVDRLSIINKASKAVVWSEPSSAARGLVNFGYPVDEINLSIINKVLLKNDLAGAPLFNRVIRASDGTWFPWFSDALTYINPLNYRQSISPLPGTTVSKTTTLAEQSALEEVVGPAKVPTTDTPNLEGQIRVDQAKLLNDTKLPAPSVMTSSPDEYIAGLNKVVQDNSLPALNIPANPTTTDLQEATATVLRGLSERYDIPADVLNYEAGLAVSDLSRGAVTEIPKPSAEVAAALVEAPAVPASAADVAALKDSLNTQIGNLEREIKIAKYVDTETGLLNRAGGDETLKIVLGQAQGKPVTVVDIGIDGLKKVNDTLGHDAGDRLITESADLYTKSLQSLGPDFAEARLVHLAGNKFRIILPNQDEIVALRVIEKIKTDIGVLQKANPTDAVIASMGFDTGTAMWDGTEAFDSLAKRAADLRSTNKAFRLAIEQGSMDTALVFGPLEVPSDLKGAELAGQITSDQKLLLTDTGLPDPKLILQDPQRYASELNKVVSDKGLATISIPANPTAEDLKLAGAEVEKMIIDKFESFMPEEVARYKTALAVTDVDRLPLNATPELDQSIAKTIFASDDEELNLLRQKIKDLQLTLNDAKYRDPMTGLYNKDAGYIALNNALDEAARTKGNVSIIGIDVAGLGKVNEDLGPAAGDRLIQEASDIFETTAKRSTDVVVRIGDGIDAGKVVHSHGDEFALILPGTDENGAQILINRMKEELAARKLANPNDEVLQRLNFDAGVARWNGAETAEAFVNRADEAMYVQKAARKAAETAALSPVEVQQQNIIQRIFNQVKTIFTGPSSQQGGGITVRAPSNTVEVETSVGGKYFLKSEPGAGITVNKEVNTFTISADTPAAKIRLAGETADIPVGSSKQIVLGDILTVDGQEMILSGRTADGLPEFTKIKAGSPIPSVTNESGVTIFHPTETATLKGAEIQVLPSGETFVKTNIKGIPEGNVFVRIADGGEIPGVPGKVISADGKLYHITPYQEGSTLTLLTGQEESLNPIQRALRSFSDNSAERKALSQLSTSGNQEILTGNKAAQILIENGYDYRNINENVIQKFVNDDLNAFYAANRAAAAKASVTVPSPALRIASSPVTKITVATLLSLSVGGKLYDQIFKPGTVLPNVVPGASGVSYYSPLLNTQIVNENGVWYRLDNGSIVQDGLHLTADKVASWGNQYVDVNKDTFNSIAWQELENYVRNRTAANPYDLTSITNAIHQYMLYYPDFDPNKDMYSVMSDRSLEYALANNYTVCFEFAATEQAYLARLGVNADFIASAVGALDANGNQPYHAYLEITDSDGKKWILDPTWGEVRPYDQYVTDNGAYDFTTLNSIYGFTGQGHSVVVGDWATQLENDFNYLHIQFWGSAAALDTYNQLELLRISGYQYSGFAPPPAPLPTPIPPDINLFMQRDNQGIIVNKDGENMLQRGCGPATAYNMLSLVGDTPNIDNIVKSLYWNCTKDGCGTDAAAVLKVMAKQDNEKFRGAYTYGLNNQITNTDGLKDYTGLLVYGGTVTSPTESIPHIAGFKCLSGFCYSLDSYFSDGKPVPCEIKSSSSLKCGAYDYHVGETGGNPDAFLKVIEQP